MEEEKKLIKVYSNQSKKARLKRSKNKFQRVWDAEKGAYIKVRKAKYPVKNATEKKDWRKVNDASALKRRQETPKKPKSVPINAQQMEAKVQKLETKQKARVEKKAPTVKVHKIHGVNYEWDAKALRYKRAALY